MASRLSRTAEEPANSGAAGRCLAGQDKLFGFAKAGFLIDPDTIVDHQPRTPTPEMPGRAAIHFEERAHIIRRRRDLDISAEMEAYGKGRTVRFATPIIGSSRCFPPQFKQPS